MINSFTDPVNGLTMIFFHWSMPQWHLQPTIYDLPPTTYHRYNIPQLSFYHLQPTACNLTTTYYLPPSTYHLNSFSLENLCPYRWYSQHFFVQHFPEINKQGKPSKPDRILLEIITLLICITLPTL